jgi:two-component system OmpR family response regulator
MRILIAEDDQVLADGLLRSLRNGGYAVDQVGSGSEADAALAAHEFDLLILDLGLPKLHGLEVLRKLRARGSSLPVLILTAADSIEQRVKASISAPTTTWPSRSRCRSSRRACAR